MSSTLYPNSTKSHSSSLPTQLCLAQLKSGSCPDRDHIITRTDSSYSRHQMSAFLQLVVGVHTHLFPFYSEIWGLRLELAQVLCRLSQSLCIRIYIMSRLHLKNSVVLILSTTSASYNLPTLSALKIPGPYGEGSDMHIQFKTEHSILLFTHLMRFWGEGHCVLIPHPNLTFSVLLFPF